MNECSIGEEEVDRVGLLYTLATMPTHPESVPINALVPIAGTPLGTESSTDVADSNDQVLATQQRKGEIPTAIDMTRMIATARCIMPRTMLRLSAGRMSYTEAEQGLMMLAGECDITIAIAQQSSHVLDYTAIMLDLDCR